jgi:hypothetical protein
MTLETKKEEFMVEQGPSKLDLMLAVFDYGKKTGYRHQKPVRQVSLKMHRQDWKDGWNPNLYPIHSDGWFDAVVSGATRTECDNPKMDAFIISGKALLPYGWRDFQGLYNCESRYGGFTLL